VESGGSFSAAFLPLLPVIGRKYVSIPVNKGKRALFLDLMSGHEQQGSTGHSDLANLLMCGEIFFFLLSSQFSLP